MSYKIIQLQLLFNSLFFVVLMLFKNGWRFKFSFIIYIWKVSRPCFPGDILMVNRSLCALQSWWHCCTSGMEGQNGPRVTQGPGVELGILSSKLAFLFGASQHRLLRLLGGLLEATRALYPRLESTNCSGQVEELLRRCFHLGQSSISLGSC